MRLIQLGLGKMGMQWVKAVKPYDGADYVAFVDPFIEAAREKAAHYGYNPDLVYETFEEALAAVEADGVICVAPPDYRLPVFDLAAEHKLHVLSEKPLADSMEVAQAILDVANANSDLVFMITQDYRYTAQAQTIKRILSSGELGRINAILIEHYKSLNYTTYLQGLPYTLLQDMSIHHFDLLRMFTESEPVDIFARSWTPEAEWANDGGYSSVMASFMFPDNIHATYVATWKATGLLSNWNGHWRFNCEHGTLTWRDDVIHVQGDREVGRVSHLNEFGDITIVKPDAIPFERQAYLLDEFRRATTDPQVKAKTTVQDNFKSIKLVFDVIEASK